MARVSWPLCFALMLFISVCSQSAAAKRTKKLPLGLRRDRDALMALKKSVADFGDSRIRAWKPAGNPCQGNDWPHITCFGRRVTKIDLSDMNIAGTIPRALKKLNRLKELDLSNNNFVGLLPDFNGNRKVFRHLQLMDLSNNLLTGDLPNRKWNSKDFFHSLEILDLSSNQFTGGLPDGWMSNAKTFKTLQYLSLADNRLGYTSAGQALGKDAWCLEGRSPDMGWCPEVDGSALPSTIQRMPNLLSLDIAGNDLQGSLPVIWGVMFPLLQTLSIQRNTFYTSERLALPEAWVSLFPPNPFPELEVMVAKPGNPYICSYPLGDGSNYLINPDQTFTVEDEAGNVYDIDTPAPCPGSPEDNPPQNVMFKLDDTNIKIAWQESSVDYVPAGYRVTLCIVDPFTTECEPVSGMYGNVYRTVFDSQVDQDQDSYVLDTGLPIANAMGEYIACVNTYNLDDVESSRTCITNTLPPPSPSPNR